MSEQSRYKRSSRSRSRSRSPSRSPSKDAIPTPTERDLNSKTVKELKDLCTVLGIDIKYVELKQEIIDRILGRTSHSGEAVARSRTPGRVHPEAGHTVTRRANRDPKRSALAGPLINDNMSSLVAMNRDNPKRMRPEADPTVTPRANRDPKRSALAGPLINDNMSSLVAMNRDTPEAQLISERARLTAQWEHKIKPKGKPWLNPATLKLIFETEMMPRSPVSSSTPTVVLLVGPAAAGKSSALKMVKLDLTDQNTVRVDPDKIYEWLADKYGYFPPELKELKELKDPKKHDDESLEQYIERCNANRDKLTQQNAARLAWWQENKDTFDEEYGREFKDGVKRDFRAAEFCTPKTAGVLGQYKTVLPLMKNMIFDGTRYRRLNVLLDTTGSMKGQFLEDMATEFKDAGYKVVIVLVVSTKVHCKARVSGPGGRNAQQHRKLDEGVVGQIWEGFVKDGTPCRWEQFSRVKGTEFVVVENTWTPTNPEGAARFIYIRNPDTTVSVPVMPDELSRILGTYNVTLEEGKFLCSGGASKGGGGSSRKRRISIRRIHGSRARKTVKKYSRHVTRSRRHRRRY